MTKTKDQQISEAFATLNAIDVLEGVPEFGKFIERCQDEVKAIEKSILDDDMTMEERERKRSFRFGMLEMMLALEKDRAGAKKFLASVGVRV